VGLFEVKPPEVPRCKLQLWMKNQERPRKRTVPLVLLVCASAHILAISTDLLYRNVLCKDASFKLRKQKEALFQINPPEKYGFLPFLKHASVSERSILVGLMGCIWLKPTFAIPLLQISSYMAQIQFGQKQRAVFLEWHPVRTLLWDVMLIKSLLMAQYIPLIWKSRALLKSQSSQQVVRINGHSKELKVYVKHCGDLQTSQSCCQKRCGVLKEWKDFGFVSS
jgi:hypothetical protein